MRHDISDLRRIAEAMDQKFRGPFGWRFGWDGLLGLIPFAGDLVTNSISMYVILRAAQIGCPPSVILRMGLNLVIENLVDVIPFFGNLFDFIWKANTKNIRLIERYSENPARTRRGSRWVLAFAVAMILAMVVASLTVAFLLLRWLYLWFEGTQGQWTA